MDGKELYETLVARGVQHKEIVKTFTSQLDGKLWYDVPFGYIPFWNEKCEK